MESKSIERFGYDCLLEIVVWHNTNGVSLITTFKFTTDALQIPGNKPLPVQANTAISFSGFSLLFKERDVDHGDEIACCGDFRPIKFD